MGVTAIVEDIHKPTKGALKLDLLIQDDEFSIQQVEHFNDAKQAHNLAMAKSVELSTQYAGPHFYTLDDDLQKLYREYLVDLSLDSDFARFVYSYAMAKEYKEYLDWLKRTREFFEE